MVFGFAANALPALVSAALWGIADFSGGMGVRSAGGSARAALRFVLLSHFTSLIALFAILLFRGDSLAHGTLLFWGMGAGMSGGLALVCFYVALSRGAMGASAALSGLLAAALPAAVSIFADGTPGWRRGCGFLAAALAIWMIAAGENAREDRGTTLLATVAGLGFGLYFIGLRFAGAGGVFATMAEARIGSLVVCGFVLLGLGARGGAAHLTPRTGLWVLLTAMLDTGGNLLFIVATRSGRLDVAAVLASLYPGSTILLAAAVLSERPSRRQGWGMAVAMLAVALVAG